MTNRTELLTNSQRRLRRIAYTPLITDEPQNDEQGDALGLAALVRMLGITEEEYAQLKERVGNAPQRSALDSMWNLQSAVTGPMALTAAAALSTTPTDALTRLVTKLRELRQESRAPLVEGLRELEALHLAMPAVRAQAQDALYADASSPETMLGKMGTSTVDPALSSMLVRVEPRALSRSPASATALALRAPALLSWAEIHEPDRFRSLTSLTAKFAPIEAYANAPAAAIAAAQKAIDVTKIFNDALTRRPLQPLGLLHLERVVMTPLAVERGELLHSLPLAPSEKVTLSHQEWTVREDEFTEFIEDYLENYSERGVVESNDIAMSTTSETSHDNVLNLSQPLSAAQGANVTGAVDSTTSATSVVNDITAQQESREQLRTVTAMSSARTIKDHKVSFTVATTSGTTDFTSHLIENKNADKCMRVDYFRRVRKWRSELYRYGVRLTYDVVLPDPGAVLRARQAELLKIQDELAAEFNFPLQAWQITPFNWQGLASQYGVVLAPPPDSTRRLEISRTVSYPTGYDTNTASDGSKWNVPIRTTELTIAVPPGFQLQKLNVFGNLDCWTANVGAQWISVFAGKSLTTVNIASDGYIHLSWDLGTAELPATGAITVGFRMKGVASGDLRLNLTTVPTEAAMAAWRLQSWTAIRDAASANYARHRSYLQDRQSVLRKDVSADDTLRLRRLEREQIMRCVLDWLFPGFQDARNKVSNLSNPGSLNPASWQRIMEYGEYIKFVQAAIDWEKVMVFLYPYFWDTPQHEHEKLFLNHPDPVHREFLRAGAARVILAIQPGFENEVVSLLDKGKLGAVQVPSRFRKAIDDVVAANAEYKQSASEVEADEDLEEPGVLIGTWADYTPVSALDIEATTTSVIDA